MRSSVKYKEQATYRDTSFTLRDRRNSLKLRLQDVSDKSGISLGALSNIENGAAFTRRRVDGVCAGYGFKSHAQLFEALGSERE